VKIIKSDKAPNPVGPYSQAVQASGFVFVSGQVGINPETGAKVEGGIEKETEQVLQNIKAILGEAGLHVENVVKVCVFLKDINDFAAMNQVYSQFFTAHKPARACVEANLVKDFLVEIDAVAVKQ
jgi:2-iminobutanoate/2-iminopropanoate deaminase